MPEPVGWARAWATARPRTDPMLRHGAWYPVVNQSKSMVVLEIRRRHAMVPRRLVEIRNERPDLFTVVNRGRNESNPALGTNEDLGRRYAVCPECGRRARLFGEPRRMRCASCGHAAGIAWWDAG